jgi:hypothetical protein
LSRSLTKQERRWLECVPAAAGRTLRDKLALLARFGVSELGDEAAIVQRTGGYLEQAFGAVLPGLRDSIAEWIQGVSGWRAASAAPPPNTTSDASLERATASSA